MIVLSILIPTKYTVEEASKWIKDHKYILRKVHTTSKHHRFRQHTTKYAKDRGCSDIRTIQIGDKQFIVAYCEDRLEGAGIIDAAKAVVFGRSQFPSDQRALLDKYGANTITSIKVGRTPLPSFINTILNILTLGAFQQLMKKSPYDKLMHLFVLITLDTGVTLLLEKNQALNFKKTSAGYNPPKTEFMEVPVTGTITFQSLIDKTRAKQSNGFFIYNAISNNCQKFILDMLSSNGILTPDLKNFIYQDVASLFSKFKPQMGIVNAATSAGTAADIISKGGKLL